MAVTILLVLAGLMGASGIILAAAGAHVLPGARLDSAAYLLLFHAVAIVGGVALIQQNMLWRPPGLAALAGWAVGSALFSSDVTLLAFTGHRLFPFAAPTGGTILILAWLVFAAAAGAVLLRH